MRDQPLQNEWLLHQGGRVDLALGVALAPRATGPRCGPNQGCLRHCSLREWCPRAAWSWPVGSQTAALVPTKDSCPEDGCCPRGCQGSWSSMEGALAAGQLAEVSSCRTSLFLSRSPLRHRGSDHRGWGGRAAASGRLSGPGRTAAGGRAPPLRLGWLGAARTREEGRGQAGAAQGRGLPLRL